jgi:hypothetical protein
MMAGRGYRKGGSSGHLAVLQGGDQSLHLLAHRRHNLVLLQVRRWEKESKHKGRKGQAGTLLSMASRCVSCVPLITFVIVVLSLRSCLLELKQLFHEP